MYLHRTNVKPFINGPWIMRSPRRWDSCCCFEPYSVPSSVEVLLVWWGRWCRRDILGRRSRYWEGYGAEFRMKQAHLDSPIYHSRISRFFFRNVSIFVIELASCVSNSSCVFIWSCSRVLAPSRYRRYHPIGCNQICARIISTYQAHKA